jgi:hypothetical protein
MAMEFSLIHIEKSRKKKGKGKSLCLSKTSIITTVSID